MKHLLTAILIAAALWFAFYLSGMGVLVVQDRSPRQDQLSCTYFVGFELITNSYWPSIQLACPRVFWIN